MPITEHGAEANWEWSGSSGDEEAQTSWMVLRGFMQRASWRGHAPGTANRTPARNGVEGWSADGLTRAKRGEIQGGLAVAHCGMFVRMYDCFNAR